MIRIATLKNLSRKHRMDNPEQWLHLLSRLIISVLVMVVAGIVYIHPELAASREAVSAMVGAIIAYWFTSVGGSRRKDD